jgi:hypothetical protein
MNADIESAGALLTAGLAAHEIDRAAPAPGEQSRHAVCANCSIALVGNFCHGCGQRGHLHSSLAHLGEEVMHGILHFDAKAWRTLPLLVARPGELTRRYIDGHRTRFVSPLALFLFMIFFLFFVGSTLNEGTVSIGSNDGAARLHAKPVAQTARAASPEETTGIAFVDAAIDHAIKNPELAVYKLKNTAYKYSFLLVPISLPFLWLMFFWRRGVRMYDHAVFALYSLSFMSLLFAAVFLVNFVGLGWPATMLLMLASPFHMFVQLRGAYRLTRGEALWRTAALQTVAVGVFTMYVALILFLSM